MSHDLIPPRILSPAAPASRECGFFAPVQGGGSGTSFTGRGVGCAVCGTATEGGGRMGFTAGIAFSDLRWGAAAAGCGGTLPLCVGITARWITSTG